MYVGPNYKLLADTTKARIFYTDGRADAYEDSSVALNVLYGLGRGVRAAFRGIGDSSPIQTRDYVDRG